MKLDDKREAGIHVVRLLQLGKEVNHTAKKNDRGHETTVNHPNNPYRPIRRRMFNVLLNVSTAKS